MRNIKIRTICVPGALLGLTGCGVGQEAEPPAVADTAPFDMETTEFGDATAHSRAVDDTIETILKTGDTVAALMTVHLATGQVDLRLNEPTRFTSVPTLSAAPTLAQANELAHRLWRQSIASDVPYDDDPIADGCDPWETWCIPVGLATTQEGCWILEEYCSYCCQGGSEGLACTGTHYECDWSSWRCWSECLFGEPT